MNHSKLIKLGFFAIIITATFFGCKTQNAGAIKATEFQAGNIISDSIFYDKDTMTLSQIEAFIKSNTVSCDTWGTKAVGGGRYINGTAVPASTTRAKYAEMMKAAGSTRYHSPPYICLTNYYENPTTHRTSFDSSATKENGMLSAAEIIYKAAQTYNINPQVLLVTLKKEYSYVFTDDWPLRDQYNTVMGYACPDSGPGGSANCSSKYYGFYNQVMNAAWQFNYYRQNIKSYNYQPGRTNNIQYTVSASCGSKQVYIENVATASLYIYTPYTPNNGALTAYPGTATCGSYGNRNFFMFFNEWFGSTWFSPTKTNPAVGDYYIVPKSDYNKSIQTNSNNNRISLGNRANNTTDAFRLIRNSDGTYTIANSANGNVFDISGSSAIDGATVIQYASHGEKNQKWYFYDNGDGSYSIASTLSSSMVLNTSSDNQMKLGVYSKATASQSFILVPVSQPVANGTYNIMSTVKSDVALDISGGISSNMTRADLTTWNKKTTDNQNQAFTLSYDKASGYYTIINPVSKLALDVSGASTTNSTSVIMYKQASSGCNQKWKIEDAGNGSFYIMSSCSNKPMDLAGSITPSSRLIIYTKSGDANQKWKFEKYVEGKDETQPIANGTYNILSAVRSNLALDISSGVTSTMTRAELTTWPKKATENNNQRFTLTYNKTTGYYSIVNPTSKLALDVSGTSTANSTKIIMYKQNTADCNQQWKIEDAGDGYYYISSACSEKPMDLAGGITPSSRLIIYSKNGDTNQKWKFETAK